MVHAGWYAWIIRWYMLAGNYYFGNQYNTECAPFLDQIMNEASDENLHTTCVVHSL